MVLKFDRYFSPGGENRGIHPDGDNRYVWKIRQAFDGGFVKKGMDLARQRQVEADV